MVLKKSLRSALKAFATELRPVEDLCYLEHRHNDQLVPLAKKHGLLGLPIASKYGGTGLNAREYCACLALIAREGVGIRTFFSGHTSLAQKTLQEFGNEGLKRRILPASCRGERILAWALTEPEAGSNPLQLETTYTERAGGFVLNGVKYLISNGSVADGIVVFARGADDRLSAFIVDADANGLNREAMTAKMGMPTTDTGMFEMDKVTVPRSHLIGKKGDGWNIAMHGLMNGRLSVAAGCIGTIEDCLTEATRYARERIQHGKPIAKHQLVQEHLTAIRLHLSSTQGMVDRAALLKDRYDQGKVGMVEADQAIAEAKIFASNAAWDAADRAVQILGGRGWSYLYRPGRHLADTRVCRIYEGTDEVLKLKIAAQMLGRDYKAFS